MEGAAPLRAVRGPVPVCIFVPSFVQRKEDHDERSGRRWGTTRESASRIDKLLETGGPSASSNRASSPVHPSFLVVFPSHLFHYPSHRSRTSLATIILCPRRLWKSRGARANVNRNPYVRGIVVRRLKARLIQTCHDLVAWINVS